MWPLPASSLRTKKHRFSFVTPNGRSGSGMQRGLQKHLLSAGKIQTTPYFRGLKVSLQVEGSHGSQRSRGSSIPQWATAVGGGAFREATGFARGPPPFIHPPPSFVACLDKTLVLGGSRQSKEMTHDHDFGNMDHKSPGKRF